VIPEPVPMSHLYRTRCIDCGTTAYAVEEHVNDALCMDDRRKRAGIDWPWLSKSGRWHPTRGNPANYPLGGSGTA